jgi:hypothetical protein
LVKAEEAERAVQLAAISSGRSGGVFVLVDADDDCAAQIGPHLLERARRAAGGVPVALSIACREYESWFLAAAECFQGFRGLPKDLAPKPRNSEEVRGAKEWLRKAALTGSYRPGVDQVLFTRHLNLALARRSASFTRFEREVLALIGKINSGTPAPAEDPGTNGEGP